MVAAVSLDTNIAIAILNNDRIVVEKVLKISDVFIPVTVQGELLFGALNSGKPAQNTKLYNNFLSRFNILPINSLVASEYAAIRKQLKGNGKPMPENDIGIAAICKVYQTQLYTHDKHFSFVKGLQLIKK